MAIVRFPQTLVVTAGAYIANDVVGGRITFTGLNGGTLQSIIITDNAAQAVDYILVLFNASPTDITDNATFDIADADLKKIIYEDTLLASVDRRAFTDNSYHRLYNLDVPLWSEGGTIYGFLITTDAPTYAATTDVTVILQVETAHKRAGLGV